MASLEDGLRTRLLAQAAVAAITTTVRPDDLDQGDSLPAITIDIADERRDTDLTGYGNLVHADVAIHCLSYTKAQARSLAEAVRYNGGSGGLEGFDGTAGGIAFAVEDIQRTMPPPLAVDGDKGVFEYDVTLNCSIAYTESV